MTIVPNIGSLPSSHLNTIVHSNQTLPSTQLTALFQQFWSPPLNQSHHAVTEHLHRLCFKSSGLDLVESSRPWALGLEIPMHPSSSPIMFPPFWHNTYLIFSQHISFAGPGVSQTYCRARLHLLRCWLSQQTDVLWLSKTASRPCTTQTR